MDTLTFLGLEPTDDHGRWLLPVMPPICSSIGALFGGCGLAAGVEAMEQVTGRPLIWATAQFLAYLDAGAGLLAVVGDYVPFGISQATGQPAGGSSLDNTLRVVDATPATEWILADVRLHAIARGFAHGLVHLWSADGRLLATAAQSAIVRRWEDHAELVRPDY